MGGGSWRNNRDIILAAALAVAIFLHFFGLRGLDPRNIGLALAGGDPTLNFLGSSIYRSEPWSLDIFRIQSISGGESLLSDDNNPIMSLIFKALRPFGFKPEWQFFGISILFCFIMNGIAAALLMRHIFKDPSEWKERAAASVFFSGSQIILFSMTGHYNLMAHFFILFALNMYFNDRFGRRQMLQGSALVFFAQLWHGYYAPMVMAPLVALVLKKYMDRSIGGRQAAIGFVAILAAFFVPFLLLFSLDELVQTGSYRKGLALGRHKIDLNGFFNPNSGAQSKIFVPLKDGITHSERSAYLGLGLIAMFCMAFPIIRRKAKEGAAKHKWLLTFVGLLFLYSLSQKIDLYGTTIIEYKPGIFTKIFEIYRAHSRFMWPAWFLIAFFAIWALKQRKGTAAKYWLLALLALQTFDMSLFYRAVRDKVRSKKKHKADFEAYAKVADELRASTVIIANTFIHNSAMGAGVWLAARDMKIPLWNASQNIYTEEEGKAIGLFRAALDYGKIWCGLPQGSVIVSKQPDFETKFKNAAKKIGDVYFLHYDKALLDPECGGEATRSILWPKGM
jgi:hypothetical protein